MNPYGPWIMVQRVSWRDANKRNKERYEMASSEGTSGHKQMPPRESTTTGTSRKVSKTNTSFGKAYGLAKNPPKRR